VGRFFQSHFTQTAQGKYLPASGGGESIMARGKARVNYLGRAGLVAAADAPDWSFIYETSTVKHPHYAIGDRIVLPDGREFRHAKSSNACSPNQGCEFTGTGYTSYTALGVAAAKGDKEMTIAAATHTALTADDLRGGYVTIFNDGDGYEEFRGIIGNDAAAANAAFKIYLDGPLSAALVAATAATETYENPYASLANGTNAARSIAGMPATYVSAADMYFWVQVKGPCWVPPQTSNVGENGGRGCFWRHDGSLEGAEVALGALTVPAGDSSQYAGYCLAGEQANIGPLFNLQC